MPGDFFQTETAKDRAGLLEVNRENVEFTYTQSLDNDVDAPMVFVLDLRYKEAAILAEAHIKEKSEIKKIIDDCAGKKVIPTLIVALPHKDAVEAMDSTICDAREILSSTIPRAYFRVMVLAFGGCSHLACQEPQTPGIDVY